MPLRFDFIVEKLKRRKASGAKLTVVGKTERPAKTPPPASAEPAESVEPKRRKLA